MPKLFPTDAGCEAIAERRPNGYAAPCKGSEAAPIRPREPCLPGLSHRGGCAGSLSLPASQPNLYAIAARLIEIMLTNIILRFTYFRVCSPSFVKSASAGGSNNRPVTIERTPVPVRRDRVPPGGTAGLLGPMKSELVRGAIMVGWESFAGRHRKEADLSPTRSRGRCLETLQALAQGTAQEEGQARTRLSP
jgi:hypothetical protein